MLRDCGLICCLSIAFICGAAGPSVGPAGCHLPVLGPFRGGVGLRLDSSSLLFSSLLLTFSAPPRLCAKQKSNSAVTKQSFMRAQPIGYCRNSIFRCPTYRHIGYIASVSLIHGVRHGGGAMGRLFWPSANTATVGARGVCCGQWSLLHQAQISANQFRDGARRVALCPVASPLNRGGLDL
jgi:hypothetical protein